MTEPTVQTPTPKPARKPGRGLRIALVLSLMVNLLVIGVVAGGAWRVRQFDGPPPGQPDIRALWHAMPREARSALRERTREMGMPGEPGAHGSQRPSREERRARAAEMNAGLIASLRAEPFDPAAFAALMEGDREALERRLRAANAAFASQLSELTPAQRAAMAAELEETWEDRLPPRP